MQATSGLRSGATIAALVTVLVGARAEAQRCPPGQVRTPDGCERVGGSSRRPREPRTTALAECPAGTVSIPGGTFTMGSPDGVGQGDQRPQRRVTLSPYCIDRTEARVSDYRQCVVTGACPPAGTTAQSEIMMQERRDRDSSLCNWRPDRAGREDHPINCVDWDMASAYCRSRNMRLPTEAEWEYATGAADGRAFPWGNDAPGPRLLNACGTECATVLRSVGENLPPVFDADDGFADTAPVGSYPAGASPHGVLDLAGNVWEWVSDWYDHWPAGPVSNPQGPRSGSSRVVRGGSWNLNANIIEQARVRHRFAFNPTSRYSFVGVRCAVGRGR